MENLVLKAIGKDVKYVHAESVHLRCIPETHKILEEVKEETKLPMWAIIHEMIKYAYDNIDYTGKEG